MGTRHVPLHEDIVALLGEAHDLHVQVGHRGEHIFEVGDDLGSAAAGPVGKALDRLRGVELRKRGCVVAIDRLEGPADQLGVGHTGGSRRDCHGTDCASYVRAPSRRPPAPEPVPHGRVAIVMTYGSDCPILMTASLLPPWQGPEGRTASAALAGMADRQSAGLKECRSGPLLPSLAY